MKNTPTDAGLLMELGRDREAVAAATKQSAQDRLRGEAMDGVDQLDAIIPELRRLVDGVQPDQFEAATPCASFTVAGVVEHMIGGATMFAPAFRGTAPPAPVVDGAGLHERFHRAMLDLLDAVHAPGAQERAIQSPFGEVPGSYFARYVAFDGLVHGWDLATATGQSFTPDNAIVGEVLSFARELLKPAMRDGDTFAAETAPPADATLLQQVVAFSGRKVVA